jgi:hypothetical protein
MKAQCCDRMNHELNQTCDMHASRFDCPDALVNFDSRGYGLIVHDGGSSTVEIEFCPWCGSKLPEIREADSLDHAVSAEPGEALDQKSGCDEPPYFSYSATLRIFGRLDNPDEVTHNLGLIPTHLHRVGEVRYPGAKPYEHDMWSYHPSVSEAEHLQVHIDALWDALRAHKDYLLRLKETVKVDVFLGYRSNSVTAGLEVPAHCLEMFTELQVPFGLSIIIS